MAPHNLSNNIYSRLEIRALLEIVPSVNSLLWLSALSTQFKSVAYIDGEFVYCYSNCIQISCLFGARLHIIYYAFV